MNKATALICLALISISAPAGSERIRKADLRPSPMPEDASLRYILVWDAMDSQLISWLESTREAELGNYVVTVTLTATDDPNAFFVEVFANNISCTSEISRSDSPKMAVEKIKQAMRETFPPKPPASAPGQRPTARAAPKDRRFPAPVSFFDLLIQVFKNGPREPIKNY